MPKFTPISVHDLGEYLREQRQTAQLSLRQLSEVAGISNPYISQIERGLKKPSAEILQALAKALRISAESLYIRAGILDERTDLGGGSAVDVTDAILADPKLNDRQRAVLLDVYESFVAEPAATRTAASTRSSNPTEPSRSTSTKPAPRRGGQGPPWKPRSEQPASAPKQTTAPKQTKQSPIKEKEA